MISDKQKAIIKNCQQSCVYFIRNFCKIKHPGAGIIKLDLFKYQVDAIKAFRNNRFNIFKKCRQSGISTICGSYASWLSMFHSNKTILIVSRRDEDAMKFLSENVKFIFNHLPRWMQDLWCPIKDNEHEIRFPNGSSIQSLTSSQDVLRSHASSLNIIDEAAFIRDMGIMWSAGFPTLQMGGRCIIVSTTNGTGNWYWNTWMDAITGQNDFNPIEINWWDMDWVIEYLDEISGDKIRICPTDGIRECTTEIEKEKYGPYWSPWLEEQWRNLQERGEDWRFKQEVLAKFVGTGNTILSENVLEHIQTTVNDNYQIVKDERTYIHPVNGEQLLVNFNGSDTRELASDEGLWVWHPPYRGDKDAHRYVLGVDIATGKGSDYFAIEVIDITNLEQSAEMMIRTIPRVFKFIVDFIGRWYNNALIVIERNNGGDAFIDEMRSDLAYPNLWRKKSVGLGAVRFGEYGFFTSGASKPVINKVLVDNIRSDEGGYKLYSRRLLNQLQIYVRKKDRAGKDTDKVGAEEGPGNHDDLVMALGLALVGAPDAMSDWSSGLMPISLQKAELAGLPTVSHVNITDPRLLMPLNVVPEPTRDDTTTANILNFANQLGALPVITSQVPVKPKKNLLIYRK